MAENPYWKSLLAISTAVSDQTKGSGGEPRVLDEENRKWLEQVMSDLVKDTDPAVQLDNVMKSLHCYAADATALKEGDLDSLEDLAIRLEDLLSFTPLTQQFVNSGGLIMLRQFIENHNEPLRVLFAKCILTFTDNNPPAQKAVLDSGILEFMLKYLEKDDGNEKLKVKYLGGVSGTVRSNETTFEGFLKLTGPDILTKLAVDYSQEKVAVKSARVLASIAYNLQDSDKYADYLLPNVIKSYRAVAARNRNDEKLAELEYIRDFFERYVPKEKLNTELLSTLIDGLKKEHGSEAQDQIKTLLKKYA